MIEISPMRRSGGWQGAAERTALDPTLSAELKRESLAALDWFRARLDSKSPWPGWEEGRCLATQFPLREAGVPRGVRLHRLLVAMGEDVGVPDLVRRLGAKEPSHCLGALVELQLAGRLRQSGIAVALVPPTSAGVQPDFRAVLRRRPVAFECTAMNARLPSQRADAVLCALFNFTQVEPQFRGSVVVHFNAHAVDAFARLEDILECVRAAGAIGENTRIDGVCVCEHIRDAGPPTVVVANGLECGTWPTDEVRQLHGIVRKKIGRKQLAAESATVLAVQTRGLLCVPDREPRELVDALGSTLQGLVSAAPEIGAVLAFETWLGSLQPPARFGGEWGRGIQDVNQEGANRVALLVTNPLARTPLAHQEIACLVGPDMAW